MPELPVMEATYAEWRTILKAMKHYQDYLFRMVKDIEDEDEQNLVYDDLQRLEMTIPDFDERLSHDYIETS